MSKDLRIPPVVQRELNAHQEHTNTPLFDKYYLAQRFKAHKLTPAPIRTYGNDLQIHRFLEIGRLLHNIPVPRQDLEEFNQAMFEHYRAGKSSGGSKENIVWSSLDTPEDFDRIEDNLQNEHLVTNVAWKINLILHREIDRLIEDGALCADASKNWDVRHEDLVSALKVNGVEVNYTREDVSFEKCLELDNHTMNELTKVLERSQHSTEIADCAVVLFYYIRDRLENILRKSAVVVGFTRGEFTEDVVEIIVELEKDCYGSVSRLVEYC